MKQVESIKNEELLTWEISLRVATKFLFSRRDLGREQ